MPTPQRSNRTGVGAYLSEVLGWSAVWLFVLCHAYTLWLVGGWLVG
jgi:hypothetical protein